MSLHDFIKNIGKESCYVCYHDTSLMRIDCYGPFNDFIKAKIYADFLIKIDTSKKTGMLLGVPNYVPSYFFDYYVRRKFKPYVVVHKT